MHRARSNYRQVKLTITEAQDGDWMVHLYAKGRHEDWQVSHLLDQWWLRSVGALETPEDAARAAVESLAQRHLLPFD